jgi:hypothetical protein
MLNYLKKFAMEILPSVAATIIGAYIVNHYIAAKPASEASVAAAVSKTQPKVDARNKPDAKTAPEAKPADTNGDVANLPEAGVKAKGISEKAMLEKNAAAEKAVVEKPAAEKSSAEKPVEKEKTADKPTETASIPAEPRRHQPTPREKPAVRVIPLTAQPAAPAAAIVEPKPAPQVEAAVAPEERRDANDLARAAIERLRGGEGAPRPKEAARAPEAPRNPEVARVPEAPRAVTEPALRPLPPPIMVSTPPAEAANPRVDDPHRPTPPAEIPTARPPLDLRAEMAEPRREKEKTSVTEDVLSAAKSVFHAVLPK